MGCSLKLSAFSFQLSAVSGFLLVVSCLLFAYKAIGVTHIFSPGLIWCLWAAHILNESISDRIRFLSVCTTNYVTWTLTECLYFNRSERRESAAAAAVNTRHEYAIIANQCFWSLFKGAKKDRKS
jgi:hypothetical protein